MNLAKLYHSSSYIDNKFDLKRWGRNIQCIPVDIILNDTFFDTGWEICNRFIRVSYSRSPAKIYNPMTKFHEIRAACYVIKENMAISEGL
jgi:hypothetical protein